MSFPLTVCQAISLVRCHPWIPSAVIALARKCFRSRWSFALYYIYRCLIYGATFTQVVVFSLINNFFGFLCYRFSLSFCHISLKMINPSLQHWLIRAMMFQGSEVSSADVPHTVAGCVTVRIRPLSQHLRASQCSSSICCCCVLRGFVTPLGLVHLFLVVVVRACVPSSGSFCVSFLLLFRPIYCCSPLVVLRVLVSIVSASGFVSSSCRVFFFLFFLTIQCFEP